MHDNNKGRTDGRGFAAFEAGAGDGADSIQSPEPVVIQAGELDLSPCEAEWGGPKRIELSDGKIVSVEIPAGVADQAVVSCETENRRYEWRVCVYPQAGTDA